MEIEAGTYTMGSAVSDEFHIPPLQKKLPTFWVDSHEVTNAQYKGFLDQTGPAETHLLAGPGEASSQGCHLGRCGCLFRVVQQAPAD